MLKVWGRKNSANVQKAMWGIGELGLAHERIDIAGAFGRDQNPIVLACGDHLQGHVRCNRPLWSR